MDLLEIIAHFGRWGRTFHRKCDFTLYMDEEQFNIKLKKRSEQHESDGKDKLCDISIL